MPVFPLLQCHQTYLTVVEDLVHGFGDKEDLSTVAPNHKQETISSLEETAHKSQASTCCKPQNVSASSGDDCLLLQN